MTRTVAEMSDVEQAQHRTWTEILERGTSTQEEKNTARIKLDALEWKGKEGPLMEEVASLTKRLEAIEEEGQTVSEADRKAIKDLRELAKRFDADVIEQTRAEAAKAAEAVAELTLLVEQYRGDQQSGWSKHDGSLVEASKGRQELSTTRNDLEQRFNEKFREIEQAQAQIRLDMNDLIATAIEEAKTAIMAEAEAAAITAVGNLMGD